LRLGILVTLVAAVPLALLAGPFLNRWAGGAYAGSAPALRALLPGIVAFAPGAVLAGDFIGRGRPHWNTQASLLTLAVNLAAGLLLIPDHGAIGAAWSSTIAYACGSVLMVYRFRQTTGLSLRSALRRRR
jgi:O-antigen/teichoic acid export membrane protein